MIAQLLALAPEVPPCHVPTEDGGYIMAGMPAWIAAVGLAAILVATFIWSERKGTTEPTPVVRSPGAPRKKRLNLIRNRKIYELVRSRWFQAVPQTLMVVVFGGLIYSGLFGARSGNVVPVAVWTLWWAGLIFAVALFGPLFCFVCPWDGIANLATRLRVAARVEPISLDLKVPERLRNVYPALVLFALLSWAELGLDVTTDPRATAYMGLGMAGLAVMGALLFSKKTFCAHLCPVGRISGLYSMLAPLEIRPRNPRACESCETEDCLNGNERGYPCPTGISLKVIQDNSMCTMCSECVKSCDRYNVALNVRPFGSGLLRPKGFRTDLAWLAVGLLALTLFHGFSMTTTWEGGGPETPGLLRSMARAWGTSHVFNFTVGMIAACAVPVVLHVLGSYFAARLGKDPSVGFKKAFVAYGYALLPVALFYHLAHNLMHIAMEGLAIVPLLSDPLGRGWDLFGTADANVDVLLGDVPVWWLQVGLIVFGHVVGVLASHRIGRQIFKDPASARRSLLPMLLVMVAVSAIGMYLMTVDMNMRLGRM